MPQDQPGFKGLVISYLKAYEEVLNIPDGFKVIHTEYTPESAQWLVRLDVNGDQGLRRITIDAEDFLGFIWDKLSTIGVNNGQA